MTEVSRLIALDRVGAGLDYAVQARPEELEPLARRLLIPAVNRLDCVFRLRRLEAAIIEAEGLLDAEVVQTCIVSAEPVAQRVCEAFTVQFVPEGTEAPDDDLEAPDQIPYRGYALDLGEAASEQLALALDPYPRKQDAQDAAADAEERQSPFAALQALRTKR